MKFSRLEKLILGLILSILCLAFVVVVVGIVYYASIKTTGNKSSMSQSTITPKTQNNNFSPTIQYAPTPSPSIQPTITIFPKTTNTPIPTETPMNKLGSRINPVPVGTTINFTFEGHEITLTTIDILRGEAAWNAIQAENFLNQPPLTGQEFVIIKMRVEYIKGSSNDDGLEINSNDFGIISNNTLITPLDNFIVAPSPDLDFSLFPGAQNEGWLARSIFSDDPNPLLFFGENTWTLSPLVKSSFESIYFSLNP